jgi:hypothetical protein
MTKRIDSDVMFLVFVLGVIVPAVIVWSVWMVML